MPVKRPARRRTREKHPRLVQELEERAARKAEEEPEGRFIPVLRELYGENPRPLPEQGVLDSPVRINPEYQAMLRARQEEVEARMREVEEQEEDDLFAPIAAERVYHLPSMGEMRERQQKKTTRRRENNRSYNGYLVKLAEESHRMRPKGTWKTYESRQIVYLVTIHSPGFLLIEDLL
jgi:hypothetical protein